MSDNIWQGEKVRLRAMEPSDWEAFHAFDMADSEMARLSWSIPFPRSTERAKQWAADAAMAEPKDDNFRFVIENLQGEVVGSLNAHGCNRRNGTFEYGTALGRQHRRKGYAREAIQIVLSYFFRELRYQKANVLIYAFNETSLKLHESLGFQYEGRLRRHVFSDGAYHDALMMGITAEEFEMRSLSPSGRG